MAENLSLETVYEIWNNDSGVHLELGNDRDGLDLIELRSYDNNNSSKPVASIVFTHSEAELLFRALGKLLDKNV